MIDPTILTILVSAIIYMEFKLEFPSMIFPTFIFNTELCWIQNSVILSTRYLSVFSIRTAQIKSYVPGQSTEFMSFPFIRFIWYIIFEKKKNISFFIVCAYRCVVCCFIQDYNDNVQIQSTLWSIEFYYVFFLN